MQLPVLSSHINTAASLLSEARMREAQLGSVSGWVTALELATEIEGLRRLFPPLLALLLPYAGDPHSYLGTGFGPSIPESAFTDSQSWMPEKKVWPLPLCLVNIPSKSL